MPFFIICAIRKYPNKLYLIHTLVIPKLSSSKNCARIMSSTVIMGNVVPYGRLVTGFCEEGPLSKRNKEFYYYNYNIQFNIILYHLYALQTAHTSLNNTHTTPGLTWSRNNHQDGWCR